MDQAQLLTLAKLGAVAALGLAAVGSALGCGTAGMAAMQTIYGMLLMMYILNKSQAAPANWAAYLGVGIFGGIGMMASAWYVGKSAADACNALGETGKGLVNYLMVLGVGETVALFVMVFSMMLVS